MKFCIWTFGKKNEDYVQLGIENFTKRVSKYYPIEWSLMDTCTDKDKAIILKKESNLVLPKLMPEDLLIVLDEKGNNYSTIQLTNLIQSKFNQSYKRIIFLIGGSYGIDKSVHQKADIIWSLSNLTFPHQLVRLILIEQMYRVCSILANEKYHHL